MNRLLVGMTIVCLILAGLAYVSMNTSETTDVATGGTVPEVSQKIVDMLISDCEDNAIASSPVLAELLAKDDTSANYVALTMYLTCIAETERYVNALSDQATKQPPPLQLLSVPGVKKMM